MKLAELLNKVYNGEIVLPDFQRSFIWEPDDIKDLLASVLGDYFIGAMLIINSTKDRSPFSLRLVEGVTEVNSSAEVQPLVKVLLDGQQRTTALFYAIYEPGLPLKGRKSAYKFYLDFDNAIKGNWDEAVIAVNATNRRKITELEGKHYVIPFSLLNENGLLGVAALCEKFVKDHQNFSKIIGIANNFIHR
ncbi:MAG: DUF262 domain-containing protein, partial [candidate division WOR-3 bacterium]